MSKAQEKISIKEQNTPIKLTQAVNVILDMIAAEKFNNYQERLVPLFLGAPGQGKSAIVAQAVDLLNEQRQDRLKYLIEQRNYSLEEAEDEVGPEWVLQSYRLAQCDPTDLKGVPVYQEVDGKQMCSYAPPGVFPMVGLPNSADGKNVLIFLDELKQAVPTIQNLAANIIDGRVGDHVIDPRRSFIVAAANRKEDKAATYDTPSNVNNRIAQFTVKNTFDDWEKWAMTYGNINGLIVGYLKEHSYYFNESVPDNTSAAYATPRSWSKVSAYMNYKGDSFFDTTSEAKYVVQGMVGMSAATAFYNFANNMMNSYSINDIFEGKPVPTPPASSRDVLFSIVMEGANRINNMVEQALTPEILALQGIDRANALVDALDDNVKRINNIYTWLAQSDIDKSFQVLINKYQNRRTSDNLRFALLTHDKFKDVLPIYTAINGILAGKR